MSTRPSNVVPRERLAGSAFGAERAMWDATLERGMVELRHKQILARVEVLNSMNTQAMLVAGAAVASMGGESLQTLDDADTWLVWHRVLGSSFVLPPKPLRSDRQRIAIRRRHGVHRGAMAQGPRPKQHRARLRRFRKQRRRRSHQT